LSTYNAPVRQWTDETYISTSISLSTTWVAKKLEAAPTKGYVKIEQIEVEVNSSTGSFANFDYYFAYDPDGEAPFTAIGSAITPSTYAGGVSKAVLNVNAFKPTRLLPLSGGTTPPSNDLYLVMKCNADTANVSVRVYGFTTQRLTPA
jgi:hypothetical protein